MLLHPNCLSDFTSLRFLAPSINLQTSVDFYMPNFAENLFNEHLTLGLKIHLVFVLLSCDTLFYILVVPAISI